MFRRLLRVYAEMEAEQMKQGRARLLLRVENLRESLAFYIDQLGWELLELAEEVEAAWLRIGGVQDEVVLLHMEEALSHVQPTMNRWLQPNYMTPRPEGLVYVGVSSVAEMELSLRSNGCCTVRTSREEPGHIRQLLVPTIDSYTLVYWEELYPTYEEILRMYEAGVEALERGIAGLSDEQLSFVEVPGKWSIREHVLHLIDLELIAMHKVKFALAEPERMYAGNSFQPDDWQEGLKYAQRPIVSEVLLFRATRQHIMGLCRHLPGALDRTVRTPNREETVAQLLKMMAGHAKHHVRAVERIRERHGI
jgi:hypothetical protein